MIAQNHISPDVLIKLIAEGTNEELHKYKQVVEAAYQDSGNPEWTFSLGLLFWRLEKVKEAENIMENGLSYFASDSSFHVLRGMIKRRLEKLDDALISYRRAISLDPTRADIYYNLANLYLDDVPELAERSFLVSLNYDNNSASSWHNLGLCCNHLEEYSKASSALKISLSLDPFVADVWCNLGLAYFGEQYFNSAMSCFEHAIGLDETHSASHINMGNALMNILKPEEALMFLERGKELEQSSANSLWNLSLAYLLLGDFNLGWKYYEARFSTKSFEGLSCPTSGTKPETLADCPRPGEVPLVVWTEQGVGDAIQFGRYFKLLDSASINYLFSTRKSLVNLFKDWFGLGDKVIEQPASTVESDLRPQIALLSLPNLFKTRLETIPNLVPYLKPPEPTPKRLLVDRSPGGLSVGLVWASNPDNKAMYRNKSMPLNLIMPSLINLIDLDLIELHSLQFGEDKEQLIPWKDYEGIKDWGDILEDFSDTAYVINQLDLIISVDTAVAHLAGALKKPTWVLLPFNADFRWLRNRMNTPWYPTMRLFRQPALKDWTGLIKEVNKALDEIILMDVKHLAKENRHGI